jgi:hypothetical protein
MDAKSKLEALVPQLPSGGTHQLRKQWDLVLDLTTYEHFVSNIRETFLPVDEVAREISMVTAKLITAATVRLQFPCLQFPCIFF